MNYNTMDYMDNGIVVEDLDKSEILHINKLARKILKIDDTNEHKFKKIRQFLSSDKVYDELKERIKIDIENFGKSEGIAYLKTYDNTVLEVNFCCVWEDKANRIVSYIFKNATEVLGEKRVSFKELAEYLPSGIIVMDIDSKLSITYANTEHYKILGIGEENELQEGSYLLRDFIYEEDSDWVLSEIHVNLAKHEDVDIEFRMITHDNDVKWVRLFGRAKISSNGEKLFYSSLKDLSQRKNIHDKLHIERVLFHKITELTDEILFRLDLETNIIHFLGEPQEIFGNIKIFENYPASLLNLYQIHKDDLDIHGEMLECFQKGIERPVEMRYKLGRDEYEWYRTTYRFVRNSDGEPVSVIGKLSNIDSQKKIEEESKTDALTGLYNKDNLELEVNNLLNFRKDKTHAFFIVNIDNFRAINENLGYHFGDMVLSNIAEDVRQCFRKNDVIGRVVGDEFVVVMRDIKETVSIMERAEELCTVLNKNFAGDNKTYNISASIGISIYPDDGASYNELYLKADTALYEIKKTGRDGYSRFIKDLHHNKESFIKIELDGNRIKPIHINTAIISNVLNLLYETNDLSISLASILEYLGVVFKVDRTYIFETLDQGDTYYNRYRWFKNKEEYKAETFTWNRENLVSTLEATNADGIYCTNDISNIKDEGLFQVLNRGGAKSVFFMDSLKHYNESMFFGIEDCKLNRVWLEEEIITLLHIGRLIFTAVSNNNTITNLNKGMVLKNKDIRSMFNKSYVGEDNSKTSADALAEVLYDFYSIKDDAKSVTNILKAGCDMFGIDKVTTVVYNLQLQKYVKIYEYNSKNKLTNGELDYISIGADYHVNGNWGSASVKQNKNEFNKSEINKNFLKLFQNKEYIYTDRVITIQQKLEDVGYIFEDIEDVEESMEVCVFSSKSKNIFGYSVFEKHGGEKLTDSDKNILMTLHTAINSRAEKREIIEECKNDILMKDVVLRNEKIPMAVIEKDTFRVVCHNDLYYNIFPNIEVGAVCYELLGRGDKCEECCIDKDLLMNDSNRLDHQWIKKAIPFTLGNGKEAYMIYSKDSIDYVKQVNATDNLTQALLRRGFEEYYKNFVMNSIHKYALCTLDVDKFKYINEIFNYRTGDNVLRKVAAVIRDFIGVEETFCRLNEDKFALFIRYDDEIQLTTKIKNLCSDFEKMRDDYFNEMKITITCGVTLVNKKMNLNTLFDQASIARKSAKGSHKNRFAYYNPEIDLKMKEEIRLEERVPHAIANNEFVPYLQPKFDLYTNKICGAEALVRWVTDEGMIYPDQFIPLFERNGFIGTLDFIIYDKIMKHIRNCLDKGLTVYTISVNVSRNHIKDKNFISKFTSLMNRYNVPSKYLELEITESIFVEDKRELKRFVDTIKGYELKISIDDFGTAYSSLQNLTDINVDTLKIDKGFLDNIDMSYDGVTRDEILVRNIISLAKELDFNVICEGIESSQQIEILKKVGCEYGQGYVFSKPISLAEYEKQFLLDM